VTRSGAAYSAAPLPGAAPYVSTRARKSRAAPPQSEGAALLPIFRDCAELLHRSLGPFALFCVDKAMIDSVRYPRELRDSIEGLRNLAVLTPAGQQITLGTVADVRITDGPPMLRSENGRPVTWIYIDGRGAPLTTIVSDLQNAIAAKVKLPPGVSVTYTGQFEYLQRAVERLKIVVPATLVIIFLLLYATFRRLDEAALVMGTLPFALTGGLWLLYLLGYNQSVATGVGFIALAGVSAEFGVVMLIYLKHALDARGPTPGDTDVEAAVREGALLRVRPKAMTVAVILAGLFPILIGTGTGSEVMSRIAAPMIGGMLTAPLLSMLVLPAAFLLLRRSRRSPHPSTLVPPLQRNTL
jgi:Cu(I)/Ag(I) efflux system membrane protein CusA/SilA